MKPIQFRVLVLDSSIRLTGLPSSDSMLVSYIVIIMFALINLKTMVPKQQT